MQQVADRVGPRSIRHTPSSSSTSRCTSPNRRPCQRTLPPESSPPGGSPCLIASRRHPGMQRNRRMGPLSSMNVKYVKLRHLRRKRRTRGLDRTGGGACQNSRHRPWTRRGRRRRPQTRRRRMCLSGMKTFSRRVPSGAKYRRSEDLDREERLPPAQSRSSATNKHSRQRHPRVVAR